MAWYDSIVGAYDTVTDSVSEGWDGLINSSADRVKERISTAGNQRADEASAVPVQRRQGTVKPDQYVAESKPFNWQMAGAVVGGLGVLLTLYKLAK